jgi:hypothetical protein
MGIRSGLILLQADRSCSLALSQLRVFDQLSLNRSPERP